jgi:hypothetical protein
MVATLAETRAITRMKQSNIFACEIIFNKFSLLFFCFFYALNSIFRLLFWIVLGVTSRVDLEEIMLWWSSWKPCLVQHLFFQKSWTLIFIIFVESGFKFESLLFSFPPIIFDSSDRKSLFIRMNLSMVKIDPNLCHIETRRKIPQRVDANWTEEG